MPQCEPNFPSEQNSKLISPSAGNEASFQTPFSELGLPQASSSFQVMADSSGAETADLNEDKGIFIKVSARVRPLIVTEQGSKEVVEVDTEKDVMKVYTNHYFNNGERVYAFEKVFTKDTKQDTLFETQAQDLCLKFLRGHNSNIIVYGPTSTGKTYTMQGVVTNIDAEP